MSGHAWPSAGDGKSMCAGRVRCFALRHCRQEVRISWGVVLKRAQLPGAYSAEAVSSAELRAVYRMAGRWTGLGALSAESSGPSPDWASPSPMEPCSSGPPIRLVIEPGTRHSEGTVTAPVKHDWTRQHAAQRSAGVLQGQRTKREARPAEAASMSLVPAIPRPSRDREATLPMDPA